jgi:hypothetical protein
MGETSESAMTDATGGGVSGGAEYRSGLPAAIEPRRIKV